MESIVIKTKYGERFDLRPNYLHVMPCNYAAKEFEFHTFNYSGLKCILLIFQYTDAVDSDLIGKWGGTWLVCTNQDYEDSLVSRRLIPVWYSGAAENHTAVVFSSPKEAFEAYTTNIDLFSYGSVGKVRNYAKFLFRRMENLLHPTKASQHRFFNKLGFQAMIQMLDD